MPFDKDVFTPSINREPGELPAEIPEYPYKHYVSTETEANDVRRRFTKIANYLKDVESDKKTPVKKTHAMKKLAGDFQNFYSMKSFSQPQVDVLFEVFQMHPDDMMCLHGVFLDPVDDFRPYVIFYSLLSKQFIIYDCETWSFFKVPFN